MVLILLIVTGAILRLNGLDYGLPLKLHPDEGEVVVPAVGMSTSGNLDPGVYKRPNHVSIYLSALGYKIFSLTRKVPSKRRGSVYEHYKWRPDPYYKISRFITAFLGTMMILSMYGLGKEVGGRRVGWLASLWTAGFPSFIQHSHYATPDIPLVFFISMAAFLICRYMRSKKLVYLFLGCLFCGLATAEKYPGALSTFLVLFGLVFSHWPRKNTILRLGFLSFLTYAFSLFIFAPFLFLNYKRVLFDLALETTPHHLGASGLGWHGNLLYYLGVLYNNMGILLSLSFLIGVLLIVTKFRVYKNHKPYLAVCLFGLVYWVLLSRVALHWERWAVPMYLAPIIIASVGIHKLSLFFKRRFFVMRTLFFLLLFILIGSLFFRGLFQSLSFGIQDTRSVSKEWISENLPERAKIAADTYTPVKPVCCGIAAEKSLDEHKKEGIEYVVVSSAIYERILREKDEFPVEAGFYNQLFEEEELVASFSKTWTELSHIDFISIYEGIIRLVHHLGQREGHLNGPEIRIYRLSPSPQEHRF